MRNTNKKGFTIVELVVVVAVIAILAAVLIPTFSGIIKKANLSADQKAARDMNTVLATEFASEAPTEIKEVIDALDEAGFNVNSLTPVSKDHKFYWNVGTREIILADATDAVIYPKDGKLQDEKQNLAEGASFINVEVGTPEATVEALNNGSDVTLTSNVKLPDVPVTIKGDVTIDLNGHDLDASSSSSRPFNMQGDSTLTINATNSVVECGIFGLVNIVNNSNAKLVINGGTFNGDLKNGAFLRIRDNSAVDITLNNVTFNDAHEAYASAGRSYFLDKNSSSTVNLTVNGGSFVGNVGFINVDTATFANAEIKTGGVAISAKNGTVSNCKITTGYLGSGDSGAPTAAVAAFGNGEVKVSNCQITATKGDPAFAVYSTGGKIIANNNNLNTYVLHKGTGDYLVKIDGVPYTE